MNKIFTGNDRAKELGFKNYRDFVIFLATKNGRKWNGKYTEENPLTARIDHGRWCADCECRESSFVEPSDNNFYLCAGCGNVKTKGDARTVVFPENKKEIEEELLKRELDVEIDSEMIDTQIILKPNLVKSKHIARSWKSSEGIKDLKKQHKQAKKVKNG